MSRLGRLLHRWCTPDCAARVERAEQRAVRAAREVTRVRATVATWQREAAREHNAAQEWKDRALAAERALASHKR